MAIWAVTGQGLKNIKWPEVWYFLYILWNRRVLANSNHCMLIRKCQAILKWFIDVKSSAWLMLGSEYETMFCDTNFFRLTDGQRVKNTKWPAVQYLFKKLSNRRIPVSLTCQRSTITATGFVGFLHHFYRCTVLVMSREMFVTMLCKVRCDKCRKT